MLSKDLEAIDTAVNLLKAGSVKIVDLGGDITAYAISSKNPDKFVIRIDIKVDKSNDRM